jgi:putative hydrolase of the HAD superfamily
MTAPRAVLFDLGDTLLHQVSFRPEAWADSLSAGADPAQARQMIATLAHDFRGARNFSPAELRMGACLRHLRERLGLPFDRPPEELELAFWQATSRMAPEPGVGPVLEALVRRGLALGVISNSMFAGEVLRWELARHGLAGAFHFLMSSADYGLKKPHRSIFQTALARLGLPAEAVWHVGDSFTNDVVGSADAGLLAVWYNPTRSAPPGPPERRPRYAELHHWDDFLALLDAPSGP